MAERVRITDVAPRDGLQNEPGVIGTMDKFRLIGLLASSGVDEVEVTSFVSPKWVPQLADAAELVARLSWIWAAPPQDIDPAWDQFFEDGLACHFSALVPNEQGMQALLEANVDPVVPDLSEGPIDKIAVFTAASETFAKKNINATIAESIKRFEPVVETAKERGLVVRGYISCAFACPFEGPIAPDKVAQVAQALYDLGVDELDLGDTIGAAEPQTTNILINTLTARLGDEILPKATLHLHDTFGRAAECVREALQLGIRSFDGAANGLGGCPYAGTPGKPAPGNIATELLVRTVHDAGYVTGVDTERLAEAARFAAKLVGRGRGKEQRARTAAGDPEDGAGR
jgi:hydroxymethylglutaryl-CoA lyase